MSRFTKLFAANAIAAAGLGAAAIALSPAAAADPIIPPVPNVPGLNMIQQLASNPAGVGAVLSTAATALNGASAIISGPATGAAAPIIGGAASTLPVSPIDVTGATPALPAAPAPAAMIPSQSLGQTVIPLLNQFGIPGNLANLAPSNVPFPIQIAQPGATTPATAATPLTAPVGTAQVPVAPTAAAGTVVPPLSLLNALP